jgi:hypothetical protein
MACTLSPEAFAKQSLAVLQGSPLPWESPKALLEITQVSRGRLVKRVLNNACCGWFVVGPSNNNVVIRLNLKQRHDQFPPLRQCETVILATRSEYPMEGLFYNILARFHPRGRTCGVNVWHYNQAIKLPFGGP